MEWTVYNFECADPELRESFVEWIDAKHPIAVPDDDDSVHGPLVDADGETVAADVAWIAEYVYVLTNPRVAGLLEDSAELWDRAVVAEFDSTTETCTEAIFYHAENDTPVERTRYEGVPELGGQAMVYRFAMNHQFRFRAYAHAPPTPMVTPHLGAFDAFVGMGWGSDQMESFEAETGVSPTAQGLAMLEDDPALHEGEFYQVDDAE